LSDQSDFLETTGKNRATFRNCRWFLRTSTREFDRYLAQVVIKSRGKAGVTYESLKYTMEGLRLIRQWRRPTELIRKRIEFLRAHTIEPAVSTKTTAKLASAQAANKQ
jgi:hypothetical protein